MSSSSSLDPRPPIADRGFFALEDYMEAFRKGAPPDLPLWEEHELAHALYALHCQRIGCSLPPLSLTPLDTGAVPLFRRGRFPWGALPYPRDHALLATALLSLEEEELARGMIRWQALTVDHLGKPLWALFCQEGTLTLSDLENANAPLELQAPSEKILDPHFGLLGWRTDRTILSVASGCKTTLGFYLLGDAGVVAYGPQTTPLGDVSGFGLAGRPENLELTSDTLRFRTRLAAPHQRQTGLSYLKDSGYSALWLEGESRREENILTASYRFVGCRSPETTLFSVFGKGERCAIAGSHQLRPRSLDRYQGPPQPVTFTGSDGDVTVETSDTDAMEVIPLGGGDAFWGADFLISYTLKQSTLSLRFIS